MISLGTRQYTPDESILIDAKSVAFTMCFSAKRQDILPIFTFIAENL